MRIILKIARAELRGLIYSPIAWVVGVIFMIAAGLKFTIGISMFAMWQEGMLELSNSWSGFEQSLTDSVFSMLYETVTGYLYLFIPLLTMGVINKEFNAGTIKLLYSSPVKPRDIVLGKFFGLLAIVSILMLLLMLLMSAGAFSIRNMDFHVLPGALTGYFLLSAAYVSIGLFISSCTHYQIVAGVITFIVFFLLHIMGTVWQQYDLVRDLTWSLSLSGRVDNFTNGLLTSRDCIYFLLIIGMFLAFSQIRLRSFHEPVGWKTNMARYLSVLGIVLVLGYVSSRPGYILYADVSNNQQNTIHPETQRVMAELGDEPVTVTLYTNLFDGSAGFGLPQNRNRYLWKFWEKYIRFHPNMQFRYVYYYDIAEKDAALFREKYQGKSVDEIAEELAIAKDLSPSMFKMPHEIRAMIDLAPEDRRLVMQLEYRGKKTWLRTYLNGNDPWPWEMHVSASVRRLLRDTMPQLLFTTGHYERSPVTTGEKDYHRSTLYKLEETALVNEGVDTDTIGLAARNIPANTSILAVADPRTAFSTVEMEKIRHYLSTGGNAIFYTEPGKQQLLNPLLNEMGVHLEMGTIVRPGFDEMPHIILPYVTDSGGRLGGERALYLFQQRPGMQLNLRMVGANAISFQQKNGFRAEPIFSLYGDDTTWIENGILVVDSAAPLFSAAEGDVKQNRYITGWKLSRMTGNKEQRIIVTGDADFMNDTRGKGGVLGNAGYSWLLYNEYPKYTNRPLPVDTMFLITEDQGKLLYIIYLIVMPAIALIAGAIILIRRNRK